jgi:hypothetical protein
VAAARNLEAMGKAGTLDEAEKEFQSLETEFARLKTDLQALQPKTTASHTTSRKKRKK